ncbi:MAG: LysE family translocator, partial [Acetanaerobacterium sp.]
AREGFAPAQMGVAAVALVDALYILAAIFGMGVLLNRSPKAKRTLQYFGAAVLVLFGVSSILGVFGIVFLPTMSIGVQGHTSDVFFSALLLTLSNPLTILFWAGVFSAKIAEKRMTRKEIYLFGLGAVLSTAFFLTLVAGVGSVVNIFITDLAVMLLNAIVGVVLILFGVKTALKKG